MTADLDRRDSHDSTRGHAPLLPAADAVVIDTSGLDVDETVARCCSSPPSGGFG